MALKEIAERVPLLGNIVRHERIRRRESVLARDLFRRWSAKEIDYSRLMLELHGHVTGEGVDEGRVFDQISILCNPSREL